MGRKLLNRWQASYFDNGTAILSGSMAYYNCTATTTATRYMDLSTTRGFQVSFSAQEDVIHSLSGTASEEISRKYPANEYRWLLVK